MRLCVETGNNVLFVLLLLRAAPCASLGDIHFSGLFHPQVTRSAQFALLPLAKPQMLHAPLPGGGHSLPPLPYSCPQRSVLYQLWGGGGGCGGDERQKVWRE